MSARSILRVRTQRWYSIVYIFVLYSFFFSVINSAELHSERQAKKLTSTPSTHHHHRHISTSSSNDDNLHEFSSNIMPVVSLPGITQNAYILLSCFELFNFLEAPLAPSSVTNVLSQSSSSINSASINHPVGSVPSYSVSVLTHLLYRINRLFRLY